MYNKCFKMKFFLFKLLFILNLTLITCKNQLNHEDGIETSIILPNDITESLKRVDEHIENWSWPLKSILDEIKKGGKYKKKLINKTHSVLLYNWTPLQFVIFAHTPLQPEVHDEKTFHAFTPENPVYLTSLSDQDYKNLLLYLLYQGADPNKHIRFSPPPLNLAIYFADPIAVEALLQHPNTEFSKTEKMYYLRDKVTPPLKLAKLVQEGKTQYGNPDKQPSDFKSNAEKVLQLIQAKVNQNRKN